MTLLHWQRYAALGDTGEWTSRLAEILQGDAELRGAPFEVATVSGFTGDVREVVDDQVPQAIALGVDLASIHTGALDLARPGADPEALAHELEVGVASLRASGCDVLLVTSAEPRFAGFNAHLWKIARDHAAIMLDLWGTRNARRTPHLASRAAHALGVPYYESRSRPSTVDFGDGFKR